MCVALSPEYVTHCRNIRVFSFQAYLIFPSVFSFYREPLPQPLRSDSFALFYILLRDFLLFVFLSLSDVFLYLYALNERESFDISLSSPFRGFRPIWSFRHRASSCCITTHTRYLQSDLIFFLYFILFELGRKLYHYGIVVISLCFPF